MIAEGLTKAAKELDNIIFEKIPYSNGLTLMLDESTYTKYIACICYSEAYEGISYSNYCESETSFEDAILKLKKSLE